MAENDTENNLPDLNLKFNETRLSKEAFEKLRSELNETDDAVEKGLEILHNRLKVVDFKPCLEDDFLLRFLRVAKFDVERAIARIHKYYNTIKANPKFFRDSLSNAIEISETFRQLRIGTYRMKDNSLMIFNDYGAFDPDKIRFEEMFLVTSMVLNHLIQNPITQMVGFTSINDFSRLNLKSFFAHTPRKAKVYVDFIINSLPIRGNKAIHIVNAPAIFYILYKIGEGFLSKKMKSRIFVHRQDEDYTSLHAKIPRELLPEQYGGDLPDSSLIDPLDDMELVLEQFKKYIPVD